MKVGSSRTKQLSLLIISGFYVFAGANHFVNADFYLPLIPSYFLFPEVANYSSGFIEILFGVGLLWKATRKFSVYAIILMLIVFIPVHIYFIQEGSCVGQLCVDPWIGWARLVVIHPLLMVWAYWHR